MAQDHLRIRGGEGKKTFKNEQILGHVTFNVQHGGGVNRADSSL